jgi:hypothetical protein
MATILTPASSLCSGSAMPEVTCRKCRFADDDELKATSYSGILLVVYSGEVSRQFNSGNRPRANRLVGGLQLHTVTATRRRSSTLWR